MQQKKEDELALGWGNDDEISPDITTTTPTTDNNADEISPKEDGKREENTATESARKYFDSANGIIHYNIYRPS